MKVTPELVQKAVNDVLTSQESEKTPGADELAYKLAIHNAAAMYVESYLKQIGKLDQQQKSADVLTVGVLAALQGKTVQ